MNNYIRVSIQTVEVMQKDLLIGLLGENGYDGFEEVQMTLLTYIPEEQYDQGLLDSILSPMGLQHDIAVVAPVNWNEEWEKNFKPVHVGNFCSIRASFHEPVPGVQYDIIITPKMSFGTGHHATTYQVIERMENLAMKGRRVLDFGTGTGVLAILAEKMGSTDIDAIDNDEWSISNSAENIRENGCHRVRLAEADRIISDKLYDIILANINRHVLVDNMTAMAQHLNRDGVLILSGLLTGDQELIISCAADAGLSLRFAGEREGWIVLELVFK